MEKVEKDMKIKGKARIKVWGRQMPSVGPAGRELSRECRGVEGGVGGLRLEG